MRIIGAIALFGAMLGAVPAIAATVTFSGAGVVDRVTGRLTPTGSVPVGSALRFSFDYDPESAVFFEGDDQSAFYDLAVSNFSATVGDYAFALDTDPRFTSVVGVFRGFSFFGGSGTEPSLGFTFYLPGPITGAAVPDAPFVLSPGSRETLSISALFRATDGSESLAFDQFRDPTFAASLTFAFSGNDPVARRGGALQGNYLGTLAQTAGVPEPAAWTFMIGGFGMIGGVMRRRKLAEDRNLCIHKP